MRVHPLAPVVGLDIDGTVGDYYGHFVWFLENIYYPGSQWNLDWSRTNEFSDALCMSKEEYRRAKLAYRLGGLKRCLPLYEVDTYKEGEREVKINIQYIRSLGVQVWICTQRPWLALTTVDSDTQYWIDRNIGQIDGLIYGEDKYADLVDIVGHTRILGVADDLPECLVRAKELGLRTAIRRQPHNGYWRKPLHGREDQKDRAFSTLRDLTALIEGWHDEFV